ncbi:MAG: 3-deoxy-8-phosphooctulonate synthase [Sphingomonadales bacterium]|nr:3-deoxy-8-phosphooctulonate synthase [Sphingomonadales bacterium]
MFLIAGPCVVESEDLCQEIAERVQGLCKERNLPYIFKASYRKANRSSAISFTGIGDHEALAVLGRIRERYRLPVLTDIHDAQEASMAANHVDVLQIPAFLARQTDLLEAAARTGRWVNIKKGQFMSASSMKFAAEKVARLGNPRIWLTERGTQFGYHDLIVDFRSIPRMQNLGHLVVVDITHSLQQPNQESGVTAGTPEFIETIGKAAIACGAQGIFLETHPNPSLALSDGANMLPLPQLPRLLDRLLALDQTVRSFAKEES